MATYPLEGYRIIDFGTAMAGPMVAQLLADMGAEVIKVESKGRLDGIRLGRPIVGDEIAGNDEGKWPDMQPTFHGVNRNKLGITIDIKQQKGLSLIKDLIRISDVVSDNFSPGVMARAGLDYEALKKIKPDIIAISLSGCGQYGPLRDVVVYAASTTALGGLNSLLGYHNEPILGMTSLAFGDTNASIHAALAILAALFHRDRTGEGQYIDLSEMEAATAILGEAIMDYAMNGRVATPQGNRHKFVAPHNNYRCKGEDKWVSIAITNEDEWQHFCEAIGNPPWTKEERFADNFSRWNNQEELDRFVTDWTIHSTPYEVTHILQKVGVAAVPVMNVEDQYSDPHFRECHTHVEVQHPLVGLEVLYGIPWRLSETPGEIRRPAPSLGEHNNYVFGELLGLSAKEILQLTEEKVIY